MSFELSGLPDYVDQTNEELISSTVLGSKSTRVLDVQAGFKSAGDIHIFDTDAVFQDGSGCGFNASGTTSITPRTLTIGKIKVQEELCPDELRAKYTQHQLRAGTRGDEEIPFEQQYVDRKIAKINKSSEIAIWQGDTASGNAQLNKFDGLIKIIDAEADVIDGNTSGATSITVANIRGLVRDMYDALPDDLIEGEEGDNSVTNLAVLCGSDVFRLYIKALEDANLYHYNADNTSLEIKIPGTNAVLMALGGLTGTDRMFAGRIGDEGGFVIGVDMENDWEKFEMWYSKDDQVMKFDTKWKMGTQIKFPGEIVEFTASV